MKTLFLDIDGTIISWKDGSLLPGVKEKFDKWMKENYQIILTTARSSKYQKYTENQLAEYGLKYERLLMEIQDYPRWVINDEKEGIAAAGHVIVKRNAGLEEYDI